MNKFPRNPKLDAQWTDDCQGKKNYDGQILAIDTRYWPPGHGDSKHSAACHLLLQFKDDQFYELAKGDFDGATEEEVKTQVQAWAQEQMIKAVTALRAAFPS